MASIVLAQVAFGLAHYVIVAIVVAAVIGIGLIVARQAGIVIPPFVTQIAWVVFACLVGIFAIRLVMGLA